MAAAATVDSGQGGMRSVGSADFQAFEEWKAMTAAAAMEAGSDDGGEWDDQDYALGAVALPVGQATPVSVVQCNDRGPYHRTTAAKRMQRHFLAAELLYI
jgi:hypothetical protein